MAPLRSATLDMRPPLAFLSFGWRKGVRFTKPRVFPWSALFVRVVDAYYNLAEIVIFLEKPLDKGGVFEYNRGEGLEIQPYTNKQRRDIPWL